MATTKTVKTEKIIDLTRLYQYSFSEIKNATNKKLYRLTLTKVQPRYTYRSVVKIIDGSYTRVDEKVKNNQKLTFERSRRTLKAIEKVREKHNLNSKTECVKRISLKHKTNCYCNKCISQRNQKKKNFEKYSDSLNVNRINNLQFWMKEIIHTNMYSFLKMTESKAKFKHTRPADQSNNELKFVKLMTNYSMFDEKIVFATKLLQQALTAKTMVYQTTDGSEWRVVPLKSNERAIIISILNTYLLFLNMMKNWSSLKQNFFVQLCQVAINIQLFDARIEKSSFTKGSIQSNRKYQEFFDVYFMREIRN